MLAEVVFSDLPLTELELTQKRLTQSSTFEGNLLLSKEVAAVDLGPRFGGPRNIFQLRSVNCSVWGPRRVPQQG